MGSLFANSGSPLGADISTGEIADGAVTAAKLESDLVAWELIDTETLSGDTSKSITLTGGTTRYKVVFVGTQNANNGSHTIRFNSDTGNNYSYVGLEENAVVNAGSQAAIYLNNNDATHNIRIEAIFDCTSQAVANGRINVLFKCSINVDANVLIPVFGQYIAGNAQAITSFDLGKGGVDTMTGTLYAYKEV